MISAEDNSAQQKTHVAIALENSLYEALKLQSSLWIFVVNPEDLQEIQEPSSDYSQRRDTKKMPQNKRHRKYK